MNNTLTELPSHISVPVVSGWTSGPNGRGTSDILWSCLSTVFLCSWTVLCLNLPSRNESSRRTYVRRLRWMFWAVAGPEFVLTVASGQWASARDSVRLFHTLGYQQWTMKHGFFADMGGFLLEPEDSTAFPVNSRQLFYLVANGYISLPEIDVEEISDKSKADTMAKMITALQAMWLLLQVMGRAAQHLAVTTLELGAVAIVVCTIATSYCWLQKPLDVRTPVKIFPKKSIHDILTEAGESVSKPYAHTPLDFVDNLEPSWGWNVMGSLGRRCGPKVLPLRRFPNDRFSDIRGFRKYLVFGFTMAYATLHLVGWDFHFPSYAEKILWRVCSAIIVGSTWLFLLIRTIATGQRKGRWSRCWKRLFPSDVAPGTIQGTEDQVASSTPNPVLHSLGVCSMANDSEAGPERLTLQEVHTDDESGNTLTHSLLTSQVGQVNSIDQCLTTQKITPIGLPQPKALVGPDPYTWEVVALAPYVIAYAMARTYLVVEVFVGLRQLPATAYDSVNWANFMPHV